MDNESHSSSSFISSRFRIVSECTVKLLCIVDPPVVPVAKDNDRGGIINQPGKDGVIPMPPAVMVNDLAVVRVKVQAPAKAIILDALLLKTIA